MADSIGGVRDRKSSISKTDSAGGIGRVLRGGEGAGSMYPPPNPVSTRLWADIEKAGSPLDAADIDCSRHFRCRCATS